MESGIELIRYAQCARQRWRNDGGWTREIARSNDGDDWAWRLSIAEVERDGPFSRFEGVDREIVLLSGTGMVLDFGSELEVALTPSSPRWRFAGEATVDCRLPDGSTRDFNLMWRRGLAEADLSLRDHEGESTVFAAAGETLVLHIASGQGRLPDAAGTTLSAGDTLLMHDDGTRRSLRLEADAHLIQVRLWPLVAV